MLLAVYSILTLITAIGSFAIGAIVLLKNRRLFLNRIWFFLCFAIGGWNLGYYFTMIKLIPKSTALLSSRLSHASGILIAALFFHFIVVYLDFSKRYRKQIIFSYLTCFIVALFSITGLIVIDLIPKLDLPLYPVGKVGYLIYVLFFSFWVVYAHFLAFKYYYSLNSYKQNQLKYFLVGTSLGFVGGGTCFPLIFGFKIHPFLSSLITVYLFTTPYAIIKYRLMNISVAITRTGVFVAVYTLILGLPFAITISIKTWLMDMFGTNWLLAPLALMAALATVGPFIYIYVERKAEDTLLKEQKRYQDSLKQASVGMTRVRSLRKLLDLITHIVTKTVRISYAAIYLHNRDTNEYVLQVSRDKGRLSIPKLTSDSPLISWFITKRDPLIYEEVKRQMEDSHDTKYRLLEENMRLLTASVVIPSFLEDRLMGFIVLGDKISGQIYSPEDLNVFQVLASQAALAIENAQFYEEAKTMQEQIAQAEKMATIGTMADGLSHQINNRFYALSLIAGDSIDTIKMTNTANCTPEVREMINDINHALERIQSNVIQGGEVVKGILKYTRKGEEGFEALSIDQILDATLEMVQYKVKISEIDIVRNYPKDTPMIKGNSVQLQEAFFNFIDNAYDSIVERRTLLQENGYRGKISVFAQPKDNNLEIIIEDNGMGVKDSNTEKIFTPFFTTKTSNRKGTGLGLYVIRRIIADLHKGKISFESKHGTGTRFILELPVAG